MTDDTWKDTAKSPSTDEIAFDYVKSSDFRVVWADGAIGHVTPRGTIHFALFTERPALPRRQVFQVGSAVDGQVKLGSENMEKRISRESIVREMACDVMLSVDVAESLAHWLLEQVEQAKDNG